jgi:hypothetical protein
VILLSYAGNTKYQKIFLRQGEEADYLHTNNDPVNSGGLSARTVTRMFSPYNLTATNLDAQVPVNGGKFVDYPTQAGAFFQWANGSTGSPGPRWAFNPYTPNVTWSTGSAGGFWSAIKANHETCPNGYRRPTDGAENATVSGSNISNSEMRQSLFQKPKVGVTTTSDISNSMEGYYADGFFDRRRLVNGVGDGDLINKIVAAGSREVAYYGRIFYNTIYGSDRYNASLFLPYPGVRYNTTGVLSNTGTFGGYWTTATNTDLSLAIFLRFINAYNTSAMWLADKPFGHSVRCVKTP